MHRKGGKLPVWLLHLGTKGRLALLVQGGSTKGLCLDGKGCYLGSSCDEEFLNTLRGRGQCCGGGRKGMNIGKEGS